MIALFRKELGELSGTLGLALFGVLLVAWAHGSIPLALHDGDAVIQYLIEDITIIGSLAAFAAGHTRFGPEYQQQTLAFLDALPTSRARIYLVKLVTGFLPIAATALGIGLIKAWALTAHPLQNAVPVWPIVGLIVLATGALMTAHYTTGLVLSWFGEVGWQAMLVSGICLVMVTILLPSVSHWYPLFDGVVHVQLVDGWPRIALAPVALWIAWSLCGVALSFVLFLGPGDRIAHGPWWIKGIAQVVVYTPPVAAMLLLVFVSVLASAIQFTELIQPTFRAETEHFRILANQDDRPAAQALVAAAEDVRAKVVERFGAEGPARLDLELTGASEHLGGVFVPGKIQLRQDADPQTLAHELSHAWSHELGAPDDPEAWRFFEEGLATLNESLVGEPAAQAAVPFFGTPASDWLLAPDHSARSRVFNPDEDYAVGRIWAEALVEVGGLEAPTCVIRAAAKAPREGSDPVPWWVARLDDCELALDAVVAAYEARLPRGGGSVEMVGWYAGFEGGGHLIQTTPTPPGTSLVCLARSDAGTSRTQYVNAFASEGKPCRLAAGRLSQRRFELAVGYGDGVSQHLGEWRTIVIP